MGVLTFSLTFSLDAKGIFEIPNWDAEARDDIRTHLAALQTRTGVTTERRMGRRGEVDPVFHLLATATGWGLNPPEDAIYKTIYPAENDGKKAFTLNLEEVPADGFWSLTMYNAEGYLYENEQDAYSLNNFTAVPNNDGTITIQFGGNPAGVKNHLPITPGWNFSFRLYRPRQEVIDGTWQLPELEPLQ